MKRETRGRYGRHQYSAAEKDGVTALFFDPPIPRDDDVVLGAIRHVLSEVMGVDAKGATVRPVGEFLRVTTASGEYDVLLIKKDNGTVNAFSIQKLQ